MGRLRYNNFSQYLKKRYGTSVYKITVDGGFTCPNRDGSKGVGGCIYCNNDSFQGTMDKHTKTIGAQIDAGIARYRKRLRAGKFMIYFQSYTGTYAPVDILKERYGAITRFKDVVSLAIGTRPDCITVEILDLLDSFSRDYDIWLELGLQSIHDGTLTKINRGHSFQDFLASVKLIRGYERIKICAHVILGLPEETAEDMMSTARVCGDLKLEAIKLHPLHVVKNTALEKMFRDNSYRPLTVKEYAELAAGFLSRLHPETIIQRLTADCPGDYLVAPLWLSDKNMVISRINKALEEADTWQGKLYLQGDIAAVRGFYN